MRDPHDELLIIKAGRVEKNYWKDLWTYRELFYLIAWRDILVRYKQTAIGVVWIVIRPLITMVVFTVLFGKLAAFPSAGVPYPLMVYAALLPWQFFSSSLSEASSSLVDNAGMLTKVYFPRLVVPFSTVMVNLVDLITSFGVLLLLMLWYGFVPSWRMLTLPFFILFAFAASFGVSLWFASLNVKYRDFRYVVPFVVQVGLYISPVGFPSSIIPERWRFLYSLNPMVGVIDGFRWAILGGDVWIYWPGFILSVTLTGAMLLLGFRYFRRTERILADII